ncbi:uncharacterized protein LOC108922619 [Scleropages formosus]|uniref:uncharacterized protein LOC108922619 n=1 Tax=Scleropages formosus TaxID=113540 RepID=UPI000878F4EF|nr:uncharacterized protein LOC108922619 [Scleropages formosus]
MASSSQKFTWCPCHKHKIPSKDTHDRCLHCLGIQHAKEAVLEYGKCPHCAAMDWSTCINRLTKVQEVLHRESQQRKTEAAQAGSKLATAPAPVSIPKATMDSVPVPPLPTAFAATSAQPSVLPVMLTILSPPPAQAELNPSITKGALLTPLAVEQSCDPNHTLGQSSSHTVTHRSKRRHSSACYSRCSKCSKHSHRHQCRRFHTSSSYSSSGSSCWSSSSSPCTSPREKRSQRVSHTSAKDRKLLEMVQQKLDTQWALMEKRVEALERRAAEMSSVVPAASSSDQASLSAAAPASTSSQEEEPEVEHVDWCGPPEDRPAVRIPLVAMVKKEEEPSLIRAGWKAEEASEGEDTSLLPEDSVSGQDILVAAELQGLISRAAKYLGISFPNTQTSSSSPGPSMVPEFENLVQSTWSNPASSRPFRELFCKMYRLNERQAPAYDRMPQVSRFMSAIFQAVEPTENAMVPLPSKHWRFTETQAERMYQTAGMLVRTANYLRYLSEYQQRLLEEAAEDRPAQRLTAILKELRLISRFSFQLSSHQAELSGRVMAGSVAIRRQVWMATTNYTDSLKATVADLPYVVRQTMEASTGTTSGCKQEVS